MYWKQEDVWKGGDFGRREREREREIKKRARGMADLKARGEKGRDLLVIFFFLGGGEELNLEVRRERERHYRRFGDRGEGGLFIYLSNPIQTQR
jgi:hypothetical protein